MKKLQREYAEPKMQIVMFGTEDIIRTSSGLDRREEAGWTDEVVDADRFGL